MVAVVVAVGVVVVVAVVVRVVVGVGVGVVVAVVVGAGVVVVVAVVVGAGVVVGRCRMTPPIFIDWETRSTVDLKAHGGWRYAESPESEVVCGVALHGSDLYAWAPYDVSEYWSKVRGERKLLTWKPDQERLCALGFDPLNYHLTTGTDAPPNKVLELIASGAPLVAHNADDFDRVVWEEMGLPEANWVDSLNLVRRRGLPGGLGKLGAYLFGLGKDTEGHALMLQACKPKRSGKFLPLEKLPNVMREIVRYCLLDVLLLAAVWREENLGAPHIDDDVLAAHRAINRRGLLIDVETAQTIQRLEATHRDEMVASCELTDKQLRSNQQLTAWLAAHGVEVPDCTKLTLEELLGSPRLAALPNAESIRAVLSARLAVNKVTSGKAIAAERAVCRDGRLRGVLAYNGAVATGRWAGRLYQPHNLPRPPENFPVEIYDHPDDAPRVAEEIGEDLHAVLGGMLRGIVVAPAGMTLGIADYSGVEARGLLWCAEDEERLGIIASGTDPYRELASRQLFNVPIEDVTKEQRKLGKLGVLSCGYGGGPGAVLRAARKEGVEIDDAEAQRIVDAWRDLNPSVAGERSGERWTLPDGRSGPSRRGGLWKALKAAVLDVIAGHRVEATAGRCTFHLEEHRGSVNLLCTLPSGRDLVYRDAAVETVDALWGGKTRAATYWNPRGFRKALWHGLIVENCVQAICRDLLAHALVQLEAAGFRTVLHVHDEVVCELRSESQLADMVSVMTQLPEWAAGFPLSADGHCSKRFGKD